MVPQESQFPYSDSTRQWVGIDFQVREELDCLVADLTCDSATMPLAVLALVALAHGVEPSRVLDALSGTESLLEDESGGVRGPSAAALFARSYDCLRALIDESQHTQGKLDHLRNDGPLALATAGLAHLVAEIIRLLSHRIG